MTQSKTRFLDRAYDLKNVDEVRGLYRDWAESYDSNISDDQGYETPKRCAEALARHCPVGSSVLDIGCGTGLSGAALAAVGFATIDGFDLTAEMLTKARGKNVYRDLREVDMTGDLPYEPASYDAIVLCGVIGQQHAPPDRLGVLLRLVKSSGYCVFSLNDHAYEENDGANPKVVDRMVEEGAIEVLEKAHGDHLPGIGLKAWVYVVRKTG